MSHNYFLISEFICYSENQLHFHPLLTRCLGLMPPTQLQAKRWCFTINNYTDVDISGMHLRDVGNRGNKITYMVYGLEVGDQGTPHIQGYLEVDKKCAMSPLAFLFPRAHFTKANGTQEQNKTYCLKDGQGQELGTPMAQGARNDLQGLGQAIVDGAKPADLAASNPAEYIRFHRGIHALHAAVHDVPRKRDTDKNVYVFYGPTGTGKTRTAIETLESLYGPESYYKWNPSMGKWWDGYDGHRGVILDEFRGQLPFGYLLSLLDRYAMKVETKGGSREFVADTVYITSPLPPDQWYKDLDGSDKLAQLLRRITLTTEML